MKTNSTIILNHIPKTGGTTLRIVFNKVYGTDRVFFIESKNIGSSFKYFKKLEESDKIRYTVIAGHGASYFSNLVDNPFLVTIIREPIELFISQYEYLKQSPNSIFQERVEKLKSIDAYIDFALQHGQDNLLTRYLSQSVNWLIDSSDTIPVMETEGKQLLVKAKSNLKLYDAVLDLTNFDCGVYSLRDLLEWKSIPLYRPANRSKRKRVQNYGADLIDRIKYLLRFDIDLHKYFQQEKLDTGLRINKHDSTYKQFILRQKVINKVF